MSTQQRSYGFSTKAQIYFGNEAKDDEEQFFNFALAGEMHSEVTFKEFCDHLEQNQQAQEDNHHQEYQIPNGTFEPQSWISPHKHRSLNEIGHIEFSQLDFSLDDDFTVQSHLSQEHGQTQLKQGNVDKAVAQLCLPKPERKKKKKNLNRGNYRGKEEWQIRLLEKEFQKSWYQQWSKETLERLSEKVGLSCNSIYKWNWDRRDQQLRQDEEERTQKLERVIRNSIQSGEKKPIFRVVRPSKQSLSQSGF